MEPNSTYDQEIDLKDLMFAVLYKWRPVVIAAVVIGLLLGGFKAFSTYKSQNDPTVITEKEADYQKDLEIYEKNKSTGEREIDNLLNDITEQQMYLEKSVRMNMSPYDVWEAKIDLFVKTDYVIMPDMVYQNVDYTDTILQAYQSALTNTEFLQKVAKKVGTEPRYLKELIDIQVDQKILSVKVNYTDEKSVKEIMQYVLSGVDDAKAKIEETIGAHTISVVDESVGSKVDLELADAQKEESTRLVDLNTSLEEKQDALDELQEPKKIVDSTSAAAKSGIKYGILGAVLGAFMAIFFVCVAFLMTDGIYAAKDLRNRYKLRVLGALPAKKAGGIDASLRKMEGRASEEDDKTYGLIAANVRSFMGDAGKILVAGCASADAFNRVAEKLVAELGDCQVVKGGNLLEDAEALEKLSDADAVVFVEECKVSKYSQVELELEKAKDLQKEVLGCVVLE